MRVHRQPPLYRRSLKAGIALLLLIFILDSRADCRWVTRGFKSYMKCSGDAARAAGAATQVLQDNIGRPAEEGILKPIDRARLDLQAEIGRPALANWIIESRNNALRAGTQPIPEEVFNRVRYFFDESLLRRVRFRIGEGHFMSLPSAAQKLGDRRAITLDYVIVFRGPTDAANDVLWAHELTHVVQYRRWGISDFAVRYLRSWNSVEDEARRVEREYASWLQGGGLAEVLTTSTMHRVEVTVANEATSDLSFTVACETAPLITLLGPAASSSYACENARYMQIAISTAGSAGRPPTHRVYRLENGGQYGLYWSESTGAWDVRTIRF
ncbi:DUF4157 domain-containing protein [Aquincola sp. S2]|uniref:DUF4157 domain-containing protein n=1 Tax=Pseudaquabacterium terrae TaxID=2732868 RepID=A0ABX2ERM8_9BURK|nr:DUF4157 domain-containing protein [Aquabacterium terrae]NRF71329.1 DUF4157 domain-containing protein [Aquabacterium terrae]